jgi:hypothetical protein
MKTKNSCLNCEHYLNLVALGVGYRCVYTSKNSQQVIYSTYKCEKYVEKKAVNKNENKKTIEFYY